MAENVDNSLMLEILKEMRTDLQGVRKDQLEMRTELQRVRTEQQEMRKEQRDQRALLLLTADTVRKLHLYTEEGFAAVKREFAAIRGDFLTFEAGMRAHRDDL
ncbi:MAG TPA: hypothetical protein VFZ16_19960 [Hyphomicrobiaceae bacterium]|nr:hypothetical protein [Hyphomicrobiaceae bacterium]